MVADFVKFDVRVLVEVKGEDSESLIVVSAEEKRKRMSMEAEGLSGN